MIGDVEHITTYQPQHRLVRFLDRPRTLVDVIRFEVHGTPLAVQPYAPLRRWKALLIARWFAPSCSPVELREYAAVRGVAQSGSAAGS